MNPSVPTFKPFVGHFCVDIRVIESFDCYRFSRLLFDASHGFACSLMFFAALVSACISIFSSSIVI